MSEKIVQLNEEVIKGQLKELVRGSVEETLNELLEQEAEKLTQAARYERNEARQGYRSGHYDRNLTTTSGNVTLHVPRLKGVSFETAIIERYRRRESSVEEALIEMYLAGVSVRRVEDITEALWGSKVSPSTISELNKKAYVHIEDWRNRPLQGGKYPYIYVDGIYLRRNWGGEYENVAILVAIAVNEDGYREVLGAAEGMKEDKASWVSFFQWLRGRGLDGVRLIVGDIIADNYASSDFINFPKRPPHEIDYMNDEDAKKFYNAASSYEDIRIKTATMILLMTGMRRGELCGLEWDDIDLEEKTISIKRSVVAVKSLGVITKEPKTESSKRIIGISDNLTAVIREYKEWYDNYREALGDRWINSNRLFIKENGDGLYPSTVEGWVHKICQAAGLPNRTVHSLRHTNITMQIAAGVPLVTVSGRAGHARTSTTTDIYSHFLKSSDRTAAKTLENVFCKG